MARGGAQRRAALNVPGRYQVRALAYSPRGDVLAAGGFDGRVELWDGGSWRWFITQHPRPVLSVAFFPGGDRLATVAGDGRVRFWTLAGAPLGELAAGEPRIVTTAAVSPRGAVLASAERSGEVRRWRLGGAEAVAPLGGTRGEVLGRRSPRVTTRSPPPGETACCACGSPAAR